MAEAIELEESIESTRCNNASETFDNEWCQRDDKEKCISPINSGGISPMFISVIFAGVLAIILCISYFRYNINIMYIILI